MGSQTRDFFVVGDRSADRNWNPVDQKDWIAADIRFDRSGNRDRDRRVDSDVGRKRNGVAGTIAAQFANSCQWRSRSFER